MRCFQNFTEFKDTVTCGTPGAVALDTVKNGSQKPCECDCKNTLFCTAIHDCKSQQNGIEFVTKPENYVQRGSSGQPHPPPLVGVGSAAGRVGAPTSLAELRLMEQQQIQQKADFFSEVR